MKFPTKVLTNVAVSEVFFTVGFFTAKKILASSITFKDANTAIRLLLETHKFFNVSTRPDRCAFECVGRRSSSSRRGNSKPLGRMLTQMWD